MTARIWSRAATLAAAGVSALALLAFTAGTAAAATVTRINGEVVSVGRGGVFRLQTPGTASTGTILAAIGVSALVIAIVSVVFLRMDRRSSPARLAALPDRPAGEVSSSDRERRAA